MLTDVTLPFAGGTFRFHLGDREMVFLELGVPHPDGNPLVRNERMRLGEVYARLLRGRYVLDGEDVGIPGRADYSVVEMDAIIRAALLGGAGGEIGGERIDWKSHDVESYMREFVGPLTLAERWDLAVAVLGARAEGRAAPTATALGEAPADRG